MKLNHFTILAFATIGTVAFSSVANAALVPNGTELNGIHMGLTANGQARQATTSNDRTGLTLSSRQFTTLKVEGGRLVGVK